MIKINLSLLFILISQNVFALGQIHSDDDWEPQRVYIYESEKDPERVIFQFCTTRKRNQCYFLGKSEGVLKSSLEREIELMEKWAPAVKLMKPVASIVLGIFSLTALGRVKAIGGFMLGASSQAALSGMETESLSSEYFSDLKLSLDPDRGYLVKVKVPEMGIVGFARSLDRTLRRLVLPCLEDREGEACDAYKAEAQRQVDELNKRLPSFRSL